MTTTHDPQRVALFHEGQRAILESIARDRPLRATLEAIVRLVEAQSDRGIMCSILLVERQPNQPAVVRTGAAPNLPAPFSAAVDGLPIGPTAGSCGAAAFSGQVVEVDDIATHPNWAPYRELALPLGLRSCWSSPIFAPSGEVLGTFAIYDREPRGATPEQRRWVEAATHLASIAIERHLSHHALATREAELRLAEAALRHSEAELRASFEHAGIGMALIRPGGRPVRVNPNFERFLGYSEAELAKMTFADFTHPADIGRDLALYHELLAGKIDHYGMEKRYVRKSGEVVWGKLTVTLVTDPERSRDQSLCIGMIEDIDAKKRLEAQMLRAQRMDGLARLASGIAHDFNNILTAIHGFTRLAIEELGDDHPTTEPIIQIEKAANRATALVRRILTLSREVEPQRQTQDLDPIVVEATSLLRSTLPKQVKLEVAIGDDVPTVRADATQIHQVVMNLGTNAAHAMPEGGTLRVTLDRVVLEQGLDEAIGPGEWARLSVSDTGTGIDDATMERLFEPFFTTKSPTHGTGLGLPMVHAIAKAHEGGVRVTTTVGKGSTFEVWLPASDATVASETAFEETGAAGRGERVLFVDDEPAIARLARRELERAGFRVATFERSEQALAAFEANPQGFDVVVSDTSMPFLGGVDLARTIRAVRQDLPIVLISGGPINLNDELLAGLDIAAVALKPGALGDLPRTLRRVLG